MLQDYIDELFSGNRKIVSPEDIIEKAFEAAEAQARKWGEGNKEEVPNHYDVAINGRDWNEYYISSTEQKQLRIAELLNDKLMNANYMMEGYPQVLLYRDSDPDATWISVKTSFTEPMKKSDMQPSEPYVGNAGPIGRDFGKTDVQPRGAGVVSPTAETVPYPDKPFANTNPIGKENHDAAVAETWVMPNEDPVAHLKGDDGSYQIAHGYRIGADRAGDGKPAEILLPADGHEKTSREHGIFMKDGDQWVFVNFGANGTTVQHADGSTSKLDKNASCPLSDGDALFFGTQHAYRFASE